MSLLGWWCLAGSLVLLAGLAGGGVGWWLRGAVPGPRVAPEAEPSRARASRTGPGWVRCALVGFDGITQTVTVRCRTNGEPPKVIRPHGALHERYGWQRTMDDAGRWVYQQEHN